MDLLKLKYKKSHKMPIKGFLRNRNSKGSQIIRGKLGLISLENGLVSFKHLEATRRVLSKRLKKIAKIWIRIDPKIPITAKLGDKRMGKGKGEVIAQVFRLRLGTVLFEVEGTNTGAILEFLKKAKKKLPIKTKVIFIKHFGV